MAEFQFPAEVSNPDFGKPLVDPAYQALRAEFPKARIVSLRRAADEHERLKGFPEEEVLGTDVADSSLYGPNRDWDMSNHNSGGDPLAGLGQQIHHHVDSRTLLRFDLSALPRDARLLGAQLRIVVSDQPYTKAEPGARIAAHAVLKDWAERGSCWNGAKDRKDAWTKSGCAGPGGDRVEKPEATAAIGPFPKDKTERARFVNLDVTDLVRRWLNGGAPNHGVLLRYEGKGCVKFLSSEFQDYPFRPTLVVALAP